MAGDPEQGPGDPGELQASSAGRATVRSGLPKSPRPPPPTWTLRGPSERPGDSGGSRPGAGQAGRQRGAPARSLGLTFGGPGPSADSGSVSS